MMPAKWGSGYPLQQGREGKGWKDGTSEHLIPSLKYKMETKQTKQMPKSLNQYA